jgi:hypothetical protein
VVPPRASSNAAPPTVEIGKPDFYWGTWGQGLLTEWWETAADLIWPQSVITYGRMRHDPQLRAVLSAFIYPLLRANWVVDGTGCRQKVTQHVADDLGLPILGSDDKPGPARRRGVVWTRHLRQSLQKLVFGHMPFERRYELAPDGLYHLANLGPRMPWTLAYIKLQDDGTVREVVQTTQPEPIPAARLVWYGYEIEGSAWAGISPLRPAFGPWLLKHETWRVHATSIRRFGMGVPTVEAPPGATQAMVNQAQQLASGMRAGDQTGAGLPPGYKFSLAGLTGSTPDALAFVKYLDQQMSKMALAGVVDLGQTEIGSRALGETFLDLFMLALQGLADDTATEATSGYPGMPGIVTDLVDVNYGEDEPAPRIVCTDVGQQHEVTAQALYWLLAYGAITADPELEAYVRNAWRMPQRQTPPPEALPKPPGGGEIGPGGILTGPDGNPLPAPAPGSPATQPTGPAKAPAAARAAAPPPFGLRRNLTPVEVKAGFDPQLVQAQWQSEVDWLLAQWPQQVFAAQRDALADAVSQAVDQGKIAKLASLPVDTTAGAGLLKASMLNLAGRAAEEMIREAGHQGVTIDPARVKVSRPSLAKVAAARAAMAGAYLSAQAGQAALQVTKAAGPKHPHGGGQAGDDVADYVLVRLNGLSQTSLRDQLGAALSAAQNMGRIAAMAAAPAAAGDAAYVATEILDQNTCDPCQGEDGVEFGSLEEAEAAYVNGGFIDCEGGLRCRGTVMGVWSGAEIG